MIDQDHKPPGDNSPLETLLPDVPRETISKIKNYIKILFEWNLVTNLTGESSPQAFCHHQLLDCYGAWQVVGKRHHWVDVGSGNGLPGIFWALLSPEKEVTLIEASQKKCSFLYRVVSSLKISNCQIISHRFEDLEVKDLGGGLELGPNFVSRGTASPPDLLKLISQTGLPWTLWYVFSSESSHQEFLTLRKKFGMSVKSLHYSRGAEASGEEGILTELKRC